jgi:hypothetical protein
MASALSSPRSLTHPGKPHNPKEIIAKESLHDYPVPFAILENGGEEIISRPPK